MPDCSAVTLDTRTPIPAVAVPEFTRLIGDALADRYDELDVGPHDDGDPDHVTIRVSDYESAWGYTNDSWQTLFKALRERGIGYSAVDYGHYTWDPTEIGWMPGMDDSIERQVGVEGQAVLDGGTWREIRERFEIDDMGGRPWCLNLVDAIDAHFGDDPKGWHKPEVAS